nr:MAG TPA: hypothetical protein [Caudoviricetes sp.]
MGIFGEFSTQKKARQPTLGELVDKYITDKYLAKEINTYITMRRQQHNLPTKISFEEQLKLLLTYPENERIEQVKKSILGGYRSLCYPPNKSYEKPQKAKDDKILGVAF